MYTFPSKRVWQAAAEAMEAAEALRTDNKALAQSFQDTQAAAVAAQSAVEDERATAAAAFQVCFAASSALSRVDLR